jgi:UBA/TS-N domain
MLSTLQSAAKAAPGAAGTAGLASVYGHALAKQAEVIESSGTTQTSKREQLTALVPKLRDKLFRPPKTLCTFFGPRKGSTGSGDAAADAPRTAGAPAGGTAASKRPAAISLLQAAPKRAASLVKQRSSGERSLTAEADVGGIVDLCDSLEGPRAANAGAAAAFGAGVRCAAAAESRSAGTQAAPANAPALPGTRSGEADVGHQGKPNELAADPAGPASPTHAPIDSQYRAEQTAPTAGDCIPETQSVDSDVDMTQAPDASAAARQALLGTQGGSTASQPMVLQQAGDIVDGHVLAAPAARCRTKAGRIARASQLTAASCPPAQAVVLAMAGSMPMDSQATVTAGATQELAASQPPAVPGREAALQHRVASSDENGAERACVHAAAPPSQAGGTQVLSTHDLNGSSHGAGEAPLAAGPAAGSGPKREAPAQATAKRGSAGGASNTAQARVLDVKAAAAGKHRGSNSSTGQVVASAEAQQELMAMGFGHAQVSVALKVCRGDQARAIEYLLSK